MPQINTAGIIIFTEINYEPGGKREGVALLSRRGKWDFETQKAQLYPGACEVSAHGKVEEGEDLFQAAMRDVEKELGSAFAKILALYKDDVFVLTESLSSGKVTYGIHVPLDSTKHIRLEPSSGGIQFVTSKDVSKIQNLIEGFSRLRGVDSLDVIAMYPDEIEALRIGFRRFEAFVK